MASHVPATTEYSTENAQEQALEISPQSRAHSMTRYIIHVQVNIQELQTG